MSFMRIPFGFAVCIAMVLSCQKSLSGNRSTSGGVKNPAKANEASQTDLKGIGSVKVPAGAFAEDYTVRLSPISVDRFVSLADLENGENIISASPMSVQIMDLAGAKVLTPKKALSFELQLASGTSVPEEYFVLLIGPDIDGKDVINYVPMERLSVGSTDDAKTIEVATMLSGYFFAAVMKGNPSEVLGQNAIELNEDGSFSTSTPSAPTVAATSLSFSDSEPAGGSIGGTVSIAKASNEKTITDYVLYWGSSASTKQSTTPIATIGITGSNLSYSLSSVAIPTGATHLLVFTKNSLGEMATGVSTLIVDLGVPTNAAVSVAFTDGDSDGGQISGNVTITAAADESDLTHYVLYWGSSATTKQSSTAIATIAKTDPLVHTFAANTSVPANASHLLVFTKNADGEMATGVNVLIVDDGVPAVAATSVGFTDLDTDGGEIEGTVSISKASNEANITHYVLYWGSDATTKQNGTPITQIAKTGSNLTYNIAANTAIPTSPTATHLLVFTKNADGEMATGVSAAINDFGVPVNAAAGLSFTDTDLDGGQISGTLTITKAVDESDVTHYVVYWGSNATTKQSSTPITTIAATGANRTYNFAANTTIPTSPAATHILVYTKNADGEMATPVDEAIVDLGVPENEATSLSFTDSDLDGGQLSGNVTIVKASNEADVTDYVLYWGSNATTKQNATPIATIPVTGSNVVHTFGANTAIPTSPTATHLLVYTQNADGEMATGKSLLIVDKGVPVNTSGSLSFTDADTDLGQVSGTLSITKATPETDVTHYVIYWGSDATTKQSGTAITQLAVTGSNLSYPVPANTVVPNTPTATHFLVYTKNADGEMATPVAVALNDVGVPTSLATGISFTDADLDGGQISGTVTITKAASEANITHYVLYWGSNATTKQSGTAVVQLAVTGANVTHNFAANTTVPTSPTATHLLVYSKNATGESASPYAQAFTDKAVPTLSVNNLAFTDGDTTSGELSGNLTFNKATSEANITGYAIYWGTNSTTKQSGTPITTVSVTGSNLTYAVPSNTAIPASATHFLIYAVNADGEATSGANLAFTDDTSGGGGGCSNGGVLVGSYCWYKTVAGDSCSAHCSAMSMTADSGTVTYAGSSGSNANCKAVIDAVDGGNNTVVTDGDSICMYGLGCIEGVSPPTTHNSYQHCAYAVTDFMESNGSARRYCACY